jgi:2-polyprenyl-3-methyl-5-hydroxy-6-metoxy-1,4-benzoquinol methylase
MDISIIENHYRDPDFLKFYREFFRCNGLCVGVYMSNFDDNENNATRDAIHRSLEKKWDLFLFFIKNYLNLKFHYLSVVDFGGGNGNTMRRLYQELSSIRNSSNTSTNTSEYLLYSYDVSRENVSECNLYNFESNTPVRIYNRNFLETLFDNCAVNLVISEETFHQVTDKIALVTEISRILSKNNGFLIFSDIFLREECDEDARTDVSGALNLSTIQKFSEFQTLAEENGLRYCNSMLYSEDIKFHYTNLLGVVNNLSYPQKIKDHLSNWSQSSRYLDIGIFVFKKV